MKASVQSNNMEFEGFCINEITLNLRAKVYSLFCKLGFENFYSTLSNVERVKLELISKYLDFKISEVWEEISEELYVEGIRPTTPDLNSIKESGVIVNEKALQVTKK
ncbi:hypothetical protein HK099_006342 [Clydaea vesicula]|uniref:Cilia- and flagella-associated protein 69 ARM repeats domain-containing protein n=1 Tax=Clydaea vesicula TaxID=447962 RepID=A0AAD5Y2K6_9FUNG|nr:hypothetical protein HK099_006342 [Clydaea vesicula]